MGLLELHHTTPEVEETFCKLVAAFTPKSQDTYIF